jgi:hypothetical protein
MSRNESSATTTLQAVLMLRHDDRDQVVAVKINGRQLFTRICFKN